MFTFTSPMKLLLQKPNKALNKAYLKEKVSRNNIETFKANLITLLSKIDADESEEHHKYPVADFLKDTWYKDLYEINTKGRTDFVVHNGKSTKDPVGVIIEVKRPTNKSEMISEAKPNAKAMHELVLYYLRERIEANNTEIKRLVITNVLEWYIFDDNWFDKNIYRNGKLKKDYENFKLSGKDTKYFFDSIAKPFLDQLEEPIPCTYFDISDYEKALRNKDTKDDNKLIALYKILSPVHLLIQPFANDSNSLDKKFYEELLHIIGLEEVKDGGKKLIRQKEKPDAASLLENAIIKLRDKDCLRNVTGISGYGTDTNSRLFNVALELCITWVNRILFIKLLEGQIVTYHKGDKDHLFLNIKTVADFDELNDLFFLVLAERTGARHEHLKQKFSRVPYLNSSLFDRTQLERETIEISELNNRQELGIYSGTVLKNELGKKPTGKRMTLQYLFDFLDAYDFSSDGGEEIQEENKNLINASVLGLIFEKINGYKDGSFFTPGFITMYMCRETIRRAVLQKFKEVKGWECKDIDQLFDKIDDKKEANTIINSLKICDPAVGSGHFLVSALNEVIAIKSELKILQDSLGRTLRDYHIEVVNDELVVTDEDGQLLDYNPKNKESQRIQEALFHEKETIIESCLFGVDINPNSVKICRLRLWIELLKNAYYTAESNYTELETLPNIDINIKCGNSLISRFALDADLSKALKKSKWTIDGYRVAVQNYRSATSKDEKRAMEEIIDGIKSNFRTEIGDNDPKVKKLQKLNTDYYQKYQAGQLFDAKLNKAQKKDKERFEQEITKLDTEIKEIKSNKIYENAFEWRFEFPEVLDNDGVFIGFNVLIGNPPYGVSINVKNNPEYSYQYHQVLSGELETYILFYFRGLNLLTSQGYLDYITPDSWLTNRSCQLFRNWLQKNFDLIDVYDFYKPFSDAKDTRCHSLLLSSVPLKSISIKQVLPSDPTVIYRNYEATQNTIKQFGENEWRLYVTNPERHIIAKMEQSSLPLENYYYIKYGLRTGDNKKYISESPTQFPIIGGADISSLYGVKWNPKYLRTTEGLPAGYFDELVSADKIIIQYVRTNSLALNARWLECAYIQGNYVPLNSLSFVYKKDDEYNLKFLIGILNSFLINRYYRWCYTDVNVKPAYLSKIPIPYAGAYQQQQIIDLVDEILKEKKENEHANTFILQKEIELLVYQLYGLTEEEIKIVEGN